MNKTIKIFDYSEYPGPRYINQGDYSGEDFYHKILNPSFVEVYNSASVLTVNLDNTAGFMSSFLDEAFGNLVFDFGILVVKKHLRVISEQENDWLDMLEHESYPQWESRRLNNETPKKTANHEAWSRLVNGNLVSNAG